MRGFGSEVRAALRGIRRTPGLAFVVVLSLAMGIGVPAGLVSLAGALVLHPLAGLEDPDGLVTVHRTREEEPDRLLAFSYPDYVDLAAADELFDGTAGFYTVSFNVSSDTASRRVSGLAVTPNYFDVLGAHAALGRLPSEQDTFEGPVAVLSYGLWQTLVGRGVETVGQVIKINDTAVTVIGVAPRGFTGTSRVSLPELWLLLQDLEEIARGPFAVVEDPFSRNQGWLSVVARRSPTRSIPEVERRLLALMERLQEDYPETNEGELAVVKPVESTAYGVGAEEEIRRYAALLVLVGVITLLVAMLNVGGVLLTQALARRRELAIRAAMGASRRALLRSVMTEAIVLVAIGAGLAFGVGSASLPLMEAVALPGKGSVDVALSFRMLAFTLGATLLVGVPATVFPALRGSRFGSMEVLRAHSPGGGGRNGAAASRKALVGIQAAMAVLVLVGAGLLVRTVLNLRSIDPGFSSKDSLVVSIDPGSAGLDPFEAADFWDRLQDAIRRLPQVEAVGSVSALPVVGSNLEVSLTVSSPDVARPEILKTPVLHVMVDRGFFRVMKIPAAEGRLFTASDAESSNRVIVVNESMARTFWPSGEALGRQVYLASNEGPFTVVGVVRDSVFADIRDEPKPTLYLDRDQQSLSFLGPVLISPMTLLVKTTIDPLSVVPAIRARAREHHSQLPVYDLDTLEGRINEAFELQRQVALLLGIVGIVALVLALVGLYGMLDHAVVVRRSEIAVRLTLGARPVDVMRRLVIVGMAPFVVGTLCGLMSAVGVGTILRSQLYGVEVVDPLTYGLITVVVVVLGLVFGTIPAIRAMAIPPRAALSRE